MVKEKWGTKRSCPKCSARFYDLGKENPVTCINCDITWVPEPILKSKVTYVSMAKKPKKKAANPTSESNDDKVATDDKAAKAEAKDDD